MQEVLKAKISSRAGDSRLENNVATADPMQYNVRAIAQLEHDSLGKRSSAERLSDTITRYTGSIAFVVLHVLLFAFWFTANLNIVPGVRAFDPFPFGILTLIVSAEGVFLAIFILISQNRANRQADRRAHLGLQVNLLAEQEMTLMLRMQQRLCEQLGVEVESVQEEAHEFVKETDVGRLVDELEEQIPNV